MASLWDGSGNIVRSDGARTGSNVWAQAKAASQTINSGAHDTHDEGLADSIERCLNLDGENAMAGVLDMNGNKIDLDADADTSFHASTDDQIDIEIGGSDVFKLVPAGTVGSKMWELLDSQTASTSATLDFTTGIGSTYDLYMFVLTNILPATDGENLQLRVRDTTFQADAADYEYNVTAVASSAAGVAAQGNSQGADAIRLTNSQGSAAGEGVSGTVMMMGPAATANHNFISDLAYWDSTATAVGLRTIGFGAYNGSTNAIDGVRFLFSLGNIASGTIALYGLHK